MMFVRGNLISAWRRQLSLGQALTYKPEEGINDPRSFPFPYNIMLVVEDASRSAVQLRPNMAHERYVAWRSVRMMLSFGYTHGVWFHESTRTIATAFQVRR